MMAHADYWFGALFGFCVGFGLASAVVVLAVRRR